ncbi:MAG: GAF domain-containing protein [Brasilonema octagenarum HA4186-MV1]|jgi:signal transduction histidine kinase|uniref:histidine kinase n=2 Tax=Brasilonema TaxID=383614 RepID=A0A856MIM6_9CYAN|nr:MULTISPECIES: ATP-binding protein [Brasilonema]MBW4625356.1 GAF domain-containing protein [Brasilonema octagenarum HA4186-MV1]NMF67174.1 histidine kinase [Brasilonema octagenarum UFV-OR1]QDL09501.1 histidine kinase [Brasilonema sennae CENA114]QDL15857.1 histidine kinase [Brasilonema octagenarum UFV-E1]
MQKQPDKILAAVEHETARLNRLYQYEILDTPAEADFDDLTKLAAQICQTPVALIVFVDAYRQWFKSKVGMEITNAPLEAGFCPYTVQKGDTLIIPDTLADPPFAKNPVVVSPPHVRFYAGIPLITEENYSIGTLCVLDFVPRQLEQQQIEALQTLSRQVVAQLEQRLLTRRITQKNQQLDQALKELTHTQTQLMHNEKMVSLGHLVAGIAHEINNTLNFIYANLPYANQYTKDLLSLIKLYHKYYPNPVVEIEAATTAIDFNFIEEDVSKLMSSMTIGSERIHQIVLQLRNFSRVEETEKTAVNIHENLENTLLLLGHRLKGTSEYPKITVIKEYGHLPEIECYAGQLNQVFMNILTNAIDSLRSNLKSTINDQPTFEWNPCIWIKTEVLDFDYVVIQIADNGPGMTQKTCSMIFDPFFTTKPVGYGTGLGLSISYQIINNCGGQLTCVSAPGQGAKFVIKLPIGA